MVSVIGWSARLDFVLDDSGDEENDNFMTIYRGVAKDQQSVSLTLEGIAKWASERLQEGLPVEIHIGSFLRTREYRLSSEVQWMVDRERERAEHG